jgi:hypothetical protein
MGTRLQSGVVLALGLGCVVQLAGAQLAGQARFTKQDADRCLGKLGRITAFANTPAQSAAAKTAAVAPAGTAKSQTTQLTDAELNSYIRFHLRDQVPAGIVEPTLNALGDGKVSGSAVIDLDGLRKSRQRGWTDPLNYLTGSMQLTAAGNLLTQNGVGRFQLESAQIAGVAIPKSLVQELLSYYSKTPENPSGISLDDPFELPARIKEIRVGRGEAMVVQ